MKRAMLPVTVRGRVRLYARHPHRATVRVAHGQFDIPVWDDATIDQTVTVTIAPANAKRGRGK